MPGRSPTAAIVRMRSAMVVAKFDTSSHDAIASSLSLLQSQVEKRTPFDDLRTLSWRLPAAPGVQGKGQWREGRSA
jgi:hypothetical protein